MTVFALCFERLVRSQGSSARDPWRRMRALEEVRNQLQRDGGTWRVAWGEINRIQRIQSGGEPESFSEARPSLPVAGAPGYVGIVNSFYARPTRGMKRRYGVGGTSCVSVVESGPQVQARSLLVFGESADAASPHYLDQAPL
jgi:acyl-homoserine-lactone acylase